MNKNWNDRADKDLFFTILSVKNIGVISGSEWTTIGNHMRTLGYGFTNEGSPVRPAPGRHHIVRKGGVYRSRRTCAHCPS
ncbi:hypothetical protein ColKHC_10553 [Colletotrichum higginsianum]|nr:hypothetical protein ColKHC_10553 [Colletotrichum higginsianum]